MLDTTKRGRSVIAVVNSEHFLEGGGFPVRRPFPTAQLMQVDPFLLFDHLGPVKWGPGEGIGAPDHPHRGFETVTYLLSGEMQHKDSAGHSGMLRPGDVQWMTAGAGVVHSELPSDAFMKNGGTLHGFQVWVNLPAHAKMIPPRYQDIPASRIPEAVSTDGKVKVRVIAGESLGQAAVIETRTPIMYLHFTLQPGGEIAQPVPEGYNALAYVIRGELRAGDECRIVHEGQMARFGGGNAVRLAVDNKTAEPADLLLLAGQPLNEPVERYGPFVMNTRAQIVQAMRDYHDGKMGSI
ncbi:MAG: pirin [Candidatus Muproteobacteria bacterium RIFCSPHIGHO2_12_FULL_60_33]|uniref:Pirin n=1 Tax=Candidatus Muproteobacteria bacterium RIFCSPLOWO2_01_FULL_60_18 TaxID=1817768 RepID=A0A1F6U626_9PROT|nr:MAG: pirin [Candidatus Muproteobacteria bacterium RIFCSPHIGHO2_01_60_12]OGI52790.1 MAG: pirin [Candidatus Muproteobacteria bacterium RIFCSPLOWO2_01_FULL_60_18]OGI55692.1 MAG: pirin [Candidatus Muproteobacteria bacterium RIFCSPHIGHO2_12_FULL_60_33]OGI58957.1 MAG: pirin [Candidatus Muproteobacteria bacterium RIFCSPHIGHO2_01_FULL_61_200]